MAGYDEQQRRAERPIYMYLSDEVGDALHILVGALELEQIRNADGEPIKVVGLPAKGFPGVPYLNHTQYKTVALVHDSKKEGFDFSGTNGYTARIDASSDPTEE
jgi:hypothetical protein